MAAQKTLLLCFWFLCSCESTLAQTPEVLTAPEAPQPVPFNLNDNVTFSCFVRGNELIWQVNNAQLVTPTQIADAQSIGIFPEIIDNGNGTLSGTLQITVSESNEVNMTQIGCHAVGNLTVDRTFSGFVNLTTFDIPEPPRNFQLTPSNSDGTLAISWDPPTNTPPNVPTTHDVEVFDLNTGDDYPTFPQTNLMLDRIFLLFDEQNTSCTPFDFQVTATNAAGTSGPSIMNETIPISPDVTSINEDLPDGVLVSFSGSDVTITLTFRRATSCSTNFPVVEHIVNIDIAESTSSGSTSDVITVTLDPAVPLVIDSVYTISVTAVTTIARRTSDAFLVYTTDVQTAMVDYIELDNRVFLTCTFATGATAQGCVFIFTLRNESERFSVTREGGVGTLCTTTTNNAEAYDTIEVVDWESDGSEGALRRTIGPMLASDERGFSRTCPLPDTGLSGGEIAGIVIVIVALLGLAVTFLLICVYCWGQSEKRKTKFKSMNIELEEVSDLPKQATDGAEPKMKNVIGKVNMSGLNSVKVSLVPHKVRKFKKQGSGDMENLLLYCEDCAPRT